MSREGSQIKWVNVVRCIGIFLIYVSHFGDIAGYAFPFAFTHHVPLFFIISGCMENLRSDTKIASTIAKTVKTILIPWLFYAVLSIVIRVILTNSHIEVLPQLIHIAKGTIRNQFFASALWFLTCAAAVRIVFACIRKLKNKMVILLVSLGLFVIAEFIMPYRPFVTPSFPYNVDSMLFYMLFYAIGYVAFPLMCKALAPETASGKCWLGISFVISGLYTAFLFFGKNLLHYFPQNMVTDRLQIILCPLIVGWFYCVIAKQLENVPILCKIGQETLHLCGNEYVVKTLFPATLSAFGLTTHLGNPLTVYVYNAALLISAVYLLIPYEKKILNKITSIFPVKSNQN